MRARVRGPEGTRVPGRLASREAAVIWSREVDSTGARAGFSRWAWGWPTRAGRTAPATARATSMAPVGPVAPAGGGSHRTTPRRWRRRRSARDGAGCSASHWTAKLSTTSLASSREPSSNRTLRRRWHVQTVRAAFGSQLVARAGTGAALPGVKRVQAVHQLRADEPSDRIRLVGAVQAGRLGGGEPDELAAIAGSHRGEMLEADRRGYRAIDVRPIGGRLGRPADRDHRDVLADEVVGLGVGGLALVGVDGCPTRRQRLVDVREGSAELRSGAGAEPRVEVGRRIRIGCAAIEQVQAVEGAVVDLAMVVGVGHEHELGLDAEVGQELGLDLRRDTCPDPASTPSASRCSTWSS